MSAADPPKPRPTVEAPTAASAPATALDVAAAPQAPLATVETRGTTMPQPLESPIAPAPQAPGPQPSTDTP